MDPKQNLNLATFRDLEHLKQIWQASEYGLFDQEYIEYYSILQIADTSAYVFSKLCLLLKTINTRLEFFKVLANNFKQIFDKHSMWFNAVASTVEVEFPWESTGVHVQEPFSRVGNRFLPWVSKFSQVCLIVHPKLGSNRTFMMYCCFCVYFQYIFNLFNKKLETHAVNHVWAGSGPLYDTFYIIFICCFHQLWFLDLHLGREVGKFARNSISILVLLKHFAVCLKLNNIVDDIPPSFS